MSEETEGQYTSAGVVTASIDPAAVDLKLEGVSRLLSEVVEAGKPSYLGPQIRGFIPTMLRHRWNKREAKHGPSGTSSIISSALRISGNLTSSGEILINGEIEGDVRGGNVLVGEEAFVRGGIIAERVKVNGQVHGDILAHQIALGSKCHLEGSTVQNAFVVEAGAYFFGTCRNADTSKPNDLEMLAAKLATIKQYENSPTASARAPENLLDERSLGIWQSPAEVKLLKAWAKLCRSPEITKIKDAPPKAVLERAK